MGDCAYARLGGFTQRASAVRHVMRRMARTIRCNLKAMHAHVGIELLENRRSGYAIIYFGSQLAVIGVVLVCCQVGV